MSVEDESVEDVTDRASAAGIDPAEAPHETSWNTREVHFTDPDGYDLVFTEPVDTERSFDDVMG